MSLISGRQEGVRSLINSERRVKNMIVDSRSSFFLFCLLCSKHVSSVACYRFRGTGDSLTRVLSHLLIVNTLCRLLFYISIESNHDYLKSSTLLSITTVCRISSVSSPLLFSSLSSPRHSVIFYLSYLLMIGNTRGPQWRTVPHPPPRARILVTRSFIISKK